MVTSARNRRSRTTPRFVDSPRRLPGSRSSWIAMAPVAEWSGPVGYTRGRRQPGRTRSYSGRVGPTGASIRRPDGHDVGVFILYAVLAGLVIGLVTGGSASRLGELRFAWVPLIVVGMAVQVLLFSTPLGDALGPLAPAVYIASNLAVLAAVWRNVAIPGFPMVLVGGACNLARDRGQRRLHAGRSGCAGSPGPAPERGLFEQPAGRWCRVRSADRPVCDAGLGPGGERLLVGDVLIGVGVAIAVVAAMHGHGPRAERALAHQARPARPARPLVRPCTDPTGSLEMGPTAHGPEVPARPAFGTERWTLRDGPPSRANPSRDGDAKPGIFLRGDRPVAGGTAQTSFDEVVL